MFIVPPKCEGEHQTLLTQSSSNETINKLISLGVKLDQEDWNPVFNAQDIDEKVNKFTTIVTQLLDDILPETTIRTHVSDKPWMTSFIKRKIKARQRAFSSGDVIKYKELCDKIKTLIKKAKKEYYHSKVGSQRNYNPARWYKDIFQLAGIETTSTINSITTEQATSTAELLQDIFTKPWQDLHAACFYSKSYRSSTTVEGKPSSRSLYWSSQVYTEAFKSKKATGSDNIPAWFLKRFHEELAPVVHDIICGSIIQCKYPTIYKAALVTPVPKVRPPTNIETDFRQISILPQMAKILEKLQLKLNDTDLKLNDSQHAFTGERSTISALTCISQNWFNVTDNLRGNKNGVHALFIDFRKAFDLVDHGILLTKLAKMNVTKSFWLWTRSFLEGRSQKVNLVGILSSTKPCPAGVPQGSVISPTLFNVYVNDFENSVPDHLSISTCKYADDCTQDEVIAQGTTSHMQVVLDASQKWATENKMKINPQKTKDMWICFSNAIPEPAPLVMDSVNIERISSYKLLGVWHQDNLKWNRHVEEIVNKANKRIFSLRDCCTAKLPREVGLTCYLTKIRSVLEYGAAIWGGLPEYLANEIESTQNRCPKILGIPRDNLKSLRERRDNIAMEELKRIHTDATHPCHKFIPLPASHTHDLRRNSSISYPISHTKRHEQSFIPRAIALLNKHDSN